MGDILVIGSGLAGLTAARVLTQEHVIYPRAIERLLSA